jgi:hypothetical protein
MGILVAWFANLSLFDGYHQSILTQFGGFSANAKTLQVWWINLFGATVQNLAIFMGVLTYIGNKQRSTFVWSWMIAGLIVWAPQDMLISLQVNLWLHVWIDSVALLVMILPLVILCLLDRNFKANQQE